MFGLMILACCTTGYAERRRMQTKLVMSLASALSGQGSSMLQYVAAGWQAGRQGRDDVAILLVHLRQ